MDDRRGREPRLTAMRIVWAALVAGVAIYACLAWYLVDVLGVGVGDPSSPLARLLPWAGVAGVLLLGAGRVVGLRGEEAGDHAAAPEARLDRYFNLRLVGLALQESAGLLMITLALVAGRGTWALAGGLAAVVVMAVSGPRAAHVERIGR